MATPASPSTKPADALVGYAPLPLELVVADDPIADKLLADAAADLEDEELLVALVRAEFKLALYEAMVPPGPWLPLSVKYKLTAV